MCKKIEMEPPKKSSDKGQEVSVMEGDVQRIKSYKNIV